MIILQNYQCFLWRCAQGEPHKDAEDIGVYEIFCHISGHATHGMLPSMHDGDTHVADAVYCLHITHYGSA